MTKPLAIHPAPPPNPARQALTDVIEAIRRKQEQCRFYREAIAENEPGLLLRKDAFVEAFGDADVRISEISSQAIERHESIMPAAT